MVKRTNEVNKRSVLDNHLSVTEWTIAMNDNNSTPSHSSSAFHNHREAIQIPMNMKLLLRMFQGVLVNLFSDIIVLHHSIGRERFLVSAETIIVPCPKQQSPVAQVF